MLNKLDRNLKILMGIIAFVSFLLGIVGGYIQGLVSLNNSVSELNNLKREYSIISQKLTLIDSLKDNASISSEINYYKQLLKEKCFNNPRFDEGCRSFDEKLFKLQDKLKLIQ